MKFVLSLFMTLVGITDVTTQANKNSNFGNPAEINNTFFPSGYSNSSASRIKARISVAESLVGLSKDSSESLVVQVGLLTANLDLIFLNGAE